MPDLSRLGLNNTASELEDPFNGEDSRDPSCLVLEDPYCAVGTIYGPMGGKKVNSKVNSNTLLYITDMRRSWRRSIDGNETRGRKQ